MEPGVIRDGGIRIGGVVVMPATAFGLGVGLGLLTDLEGFLITVSATAVVTPAAVGRRVVGGGRR